LREIVVCEHYCRLNVDTNTFSESELNGYMIWIPNTDLQCDGYDADSTLPPDWH